jgi:membrane protease subunit (stomatin/prohibitin family)
MFGRFKKAVSSAADTVTGAVKEVATVDVLSWKDFNQNIVAKRVPEDGSANIRWGTQVIVKQGQAAVLYCDGVPCDVLGPGRHTLETKNMPLLHKVVSKFVNNEETPFFAEAFFVNQATLPMKWGTRQPIVISTVELKNLQVQAHGIAKLKVVDPATFLAEMVQSRAFFTLDELKAILVNDICMELSAAGGKKASWEEFYTSQRDISAATKIRVAKSLGMFGIEIADFDIGGFSLTPDSQKRLDKVVDKEADQTVGFRVTAGRSQQDMANYAAMQQADAMVAAANNSGTTGQAMGAGLGLGMGMGMGGMMQNQMNPGYPGYPPPGYPPPGYPPPGYPPPGYPPQGGYPQHGHAQGHPPQQAAPPQAPADPNQAKLAKLRELVDMGVLTQQEFEAKAAEIAATSGPAAADPNQAKIAKMKELVDMGVLTQEEFEAKVAQLG